MVNPSHAKTLHNESAYWYEGKTPQIRASDLTSNLTCNNPTLDQTLAIQSLTLFTQQP